MFWKEIYWPRAVLLGANVCVPIVTIAFGFPWVLMWMAFVAHTAFFWALMLPLCNWLGPVVTRFEPSGREVWLTIDDGPDEGKTEILAAELSKRGVRATFFVKGKQLAEQPAAARALVEAGQSLANHTETHPISKFWYLLPARLRREIDGCNQALSLAGAQATGWFRAPLGFKNIFLHGVLKRRGMRLVAWSLRGHDGLVCRTESVVKRVGRRVKPGSIILLHEGLPESNQTILCVVDTLLAQGYSFVIPADARLA